MVVVEVTPSNEMRVILCLKFKRCAPCDAVAKLKQDLVNCECVVRSFEASGAFDFMIEAELRDFAGYHALLHAFAQEFATLVRRQKASFVCRRSRRVADHDQAIWVPSREGRRRIDCSAIDFIRAEGDYIRLHCGEQNWLLHDTMHHIRELLDRKTFLTLHRSTIANAHSIKQLVHRRHYWVAIFGDDTEQRIAKSQVAAILAALHGHASTHNVDPPIWRQITKISTPSAENRMRQFRIPANLR